VVAIAGHRTTFGAPFRHIDELRAGDTITLSTVYGRFSYRVFAHEIVAKDDWSIIRPRRSETLVLSACHPLYSARQRWIVYARLVASDLR
jgi:sortase A